MKAARNVIMAACTLTMFNLSLTSVATAGEAISVKRNVVSDLPKSALRRAELQRGAARFGTNTRGGNADTVPHAKTAQEVVDFIRMCDINGGGISSEPDPDDPDGVILDCSVN